VLEEAGSGIEKVVKVNVFITDMANFTVRFLH
jgi:enamine deaminase RidA (YjgF/YER057c/UK114 family)